MDIPPLVRNPQLLSVIATPSTAYNALPAGVELSRAIQDTLKSFVNRFLLKSMFHDKATVLYPSFDDRRTAKTAWTEARHDIARLVWANTLEALSCRDGDTPCIFDDLFRGAVVNRLLDSGLISLDGPAHAASPHLLLPPEATLALHSEVSDLLHGVRELERELDPTTEPPPLSLPPPTSAPAPARALDASHVQRRIYGMDSNGLSSYLSSVIVYMLDCALEAYCQRLTTEPAFALPVPAAEGLVQAVGPRWTPPAWLMKYMVAKWDVSNELLGHISQSYILPEGVQERGLQPWLLSARLSLHLCSVMRNEAQHLRVPAGLLVHVLRWPTREVVAPAPAPGPTVQEYVEVLSQAVERIMEAWKRKNSSDSAALRSQLRRLEEHLARTTELIEMLEVVGEEYDKR